ncbi:MAG: hypothetical protein SW833_24355 [Cyanobacteriota bacterium]|nr:hypothetical protein [Cyanobacteriota bacterium]
MSVQPSTTTSNFPVSFTRIDLPAGGSQSGNIADSFSQTIYNKELWDARVESLKSKLEQEFGFPYCLVSRKTLKTEESKSEEHIILQGLGTKWIKLPPGFVADTINNGMSKSEGDFLNNGLIGNFRPLYLTKRKSKLLKGEDGGEIELKNEPETGTIMEIKGIEIPELYKVVSQKQQGPGEFTLPIRYKVAQRLNVSRYLHKMAYLTLAVHRSDLFFELPLTSVQELIEQGTPETCRPYSEEFIPGAAPGFQLDFLMRKQNLTEKVWITNLFVRLKIHHVQYQFNLIGSQNYFLEEYGNLQYYPETISET